MFSLNVSLRVNYIGTKKILSFQQGELFYTVFIFLFIPALNRKIVEFNLTLFVCRELDSKTYRCNDNAVNRKKKDHWKWTFLSSSYQPDSFLFLSFWSDWVALSVWLLAVSFGSRGTGNVTGRGSVCVTYSFCFCVSFNNLESHHSFARTSFKSGGSWINKNSTLLLQYNLWRSVICCAPFPLLRITMWS